MDERRNPYVPTAGAQPPELTGRGAFLNQAEVALDRGLVGRYSKSFVAVGLRGVGKTVLLNRVAELAEERGYRHALCEAVEEKPLPSLLVPQLRRILLEMNRIGAATAQMKRALGALRRFVGTLTVKIEGVEFGVDVADEAGIADSGDLETDLPDLFSMVGKAAAERRTGVALLIDEIQYLAEPELGALVMALHRVAQQNLPVVFVGAGLPQLVGKIGRSKSYAERLLDFPEIGALADADARRAVEEPAREQGVEFRPDALTRILDVTEGYPFFLQEWGYQAWNVAAESPITSDDVVTASREAVRRLDGSFFRVRFDRLTPGQKRYLRAMAELGPGPHRSGDIAAQLGMKVTSVGPVRGELISKGMVYGPAHGDTAFTVPLFDQYMRRVMPFERPVPPRSAR